MHAITFILTAFLASPASAYIPFKKPVVREEASTTGLPVITAPTPSTTFSAPTSGVTSILTTPTASASALPTTTSGFVTLVDPTEPGVYTLLTQIPVTSVVSLNTTLPVSPTIPGSNLTAVPIATNATITVGFVPYTTVVSVPITSGASGSVSILSSFSASLPGSILSFPSGSSASAVTSTAAVTSFTGSTVPDPVQTLAATQ